MKQKRVLFMYTVYLSGINTDDASYKRRKEETLPQLKCSQPKYNYQFVVKELYILVLKYPRVKNQSPSSILI